MRCHLANASRLVQSGMSDVVVGHGSLPSTILFNSAAVKRTSISNRHDSKFAPVKTGIFDVSSRLSAIVCWVELKELSDER